MYLGKWMVSVSTSSRWIGSTCLRGTLSTWCGISGSKVSRLTSSTIRLSERSFLAGLIATYSDLTRGLVLCEEERTLDGTLQASDVWTQATWLSRHSGSNNHLRFSQVNWTLLYFCWLYWCGNLVVGWELSPFPSTCPITHNPRKCFCLHAFLDILLSTTLVHFQLH